MRDDPSVPISELATGHAVYADRLIALLLLFVLLFLPSGILEAQEGRSLHWSEIAVQARLDADGRLHVRERQAIVFDGAWNGGERVFNLRLGQELRLRGVTRIDPETGRGTPLVRGDLRNVDEFDWVDGKTVRWRSRLASDPPFRNEEIVYELEYALWPVLVPAADGEYMLRHDFAFPDRDGIIERFRVELTLDPAWAGPAGARIEEGADRLPPGRGYTISVPLRYLGEGVPAEVPVGAPRWARLLGVVGALLVPLATFIGLRRRDRELDRIAPLTPPASIDEVWLERHIFTHPAEVVGASWDRWVGPPEVAALLARLVAEGRLTSRIEAGGREPVLHLRRVAPLTDFSEHERDLLESLFFAGGDETDTTAIREHYKTDGFDPAAKIRAALNTQVAALPGAGRVRRNWLPSLGIVVLGVVLAMAGPVGIGLLGILGVLVAVIVMAVAIGPAVILSRRVTHRTGPMVGVVLPLAGSAALLALLSSGVFEGERGLLFHRPDVPLLLGFLVLLSGTAMLATALSRSTETTERLAFRRLLVSAREFFERELDTAQPRLQDAWFPYLLAFGLGPHIDRWFRAFAAPDSSGSIAPLVVATTSSTGGSGGTGTGGSWSGGGAQFGGGTFSGGGAGGTWGVAAAGMAAGVTAPSSSGGGSSGGSSSGGGGGGGW